MMLLANQAARRRVVGIISEFKTGMHRSREPGRRGF